MIDKFYKMQGAGNDFLITDRISGEGATFSKNEIVFLCDRHYGIGADGVVVLSRSKVADVKWDFYNSDGSNAEMCGNAARCVVRYVSERYLPEETVSIETKVGVIKGRKIHNQSIEVCLLPQSNYEPNYEETVLEVGEDVFQVFRINTGVPHAVVEVKDLATYPVDRIGSQIQKHPIFQPQGTNVTFFDRVVGKRIRSTTYERGVNAETLACGTGAAAAAIVFCENYMESLPVTVHLPGGDLEVDLSPVSKVLLLRGPADYVFEVELAEFPRGYEQKTPYGARRKHETF